MVLQQDGEIIWDYALPDELQKKYSVSDVARFSRWYLQDYPVLTDAMPYGLLVIGYQPDLVFGVSMTKLYYVTDAGFVRAAIAGAVLLMVMNILLVVFLFWNNTRKVEVCSNKCGYYCNVVKVKDKIYYIHNYSTVKVFDSSLSLLYSSSNEKVLTLDEIIRKMEEEYI